MTEPQQPITLEEAGALLGGAAKPWSRKTVERMIAARLLFDYGYGATRRVLLSDVERLIDQFATGEARWPLRKQSKKSEEGTTPVVFTNPQKDRGGGSRRSESKAKTPAVVRLVSKPPMRNS